MIKLIGYKEKAPVVILAAGDYPCSTLALALLDGAQKVVCCDGAASEFVKRGGKPYAIVGDCDSLDNSLHDRFAEIIRCDPDQQTNDLTKAVNLCVSEGMNDILILGATGKREDHTISNISLLAEFAAMPGLKRIRMVTDHAQLDAVTPKTKSSQEFTFETFPGQQVSLFTPIPNTCITTDELKYPLENALLRGWWAGTLNEATGDSFSMEANGPLIVYRLLQK